MWPSIRHWLDSLMRDHWPRKCAARPQALHYAWERAGFVVADQPIPWSAEAVVVEALLRLPAGMGRDRADFLARTEGEAVTCDQLRPVEADVHRAVFRLPPPSRTCAVEILHRGRTFGQLTLPVLSRADFLGQLRLETPTVYARLAARRGREEAIACRTFVAGQCSGLLASAQLCSAAGLVPLLDLDVEVEFRRGGGRAAHRVPVRLSASQLRGSSALVSVASSHAPRRAGAYAVTWFVGGEEKARQDLRAISEEAFERSLRLADARFVVQQPGQPVRVVRQPPPAGTAERVGPCFIVASGEPGAAGRCRFSTVAHVAGAIRPPLLLEQQVLISDGPAAVAAGTLDAADLAHVSGFELRTAARALGLLPLAPAPAAELTAEGGFRPPVDYAWTPAADEEMGDRLNRLLGP